MARVKYPVKAVLARFLPIYNHLTNMAGFLSEAGLTEMALRTMNFNQYLRSFEKEIKALRMESVKCRS